MPSRGDTCALSATDARCPPHVSGMAVMRKPLVLPVVLEESRAGGVGCPQGAGQHCSAAVAPAAAAAWRQPGAAAGGQPAVCAGGGARALRRRLGRGGHSGGGRGSSPKRRGHPGLRGGGHPGRCAPGGPRRVLHSSAGAGQAPLPCGAVVHRMARCHGPRSMVGLAAAAILPPAASVSPAASVRASAVEEGRGDGARSTACGLC